MASSASRRPAPRLSPAARRQLALRRFAAKVSVDPSGCWIWIGAISAGTGYGAFRPYGRALPAHRFAYAEFRGAIPEGLEIDHLCRNRACVNPDHLEPVTHQENMRRGKGYAGDFACASGHPRTPENTGIRRSGALAGQHYCRVCQRQQRRRWGGAHPRRYEMQEMLTREEWELAYQHHSLPQLAEQFGTNSESVRRALIAHGLARRPISEAKRLGR